MGDSNLHHLGCPNHILKNQVQSGGPELKEKKTKKKVKTVKITVEYLFFTKITSLCFIKKNGSIQMI
jgi:hypothetical protein